MSINTVEELPPVAGGYSPGVWLERLNDAYEDADGTHWHLVFEAETPDKAGSAVSNLKRRKVQARAQTGAAAPSGAATGGQAKKDSENR